MNKRKITLAVDAMGGEKAPFSVVKAIKEHKNSEIHFLICGNQDILTPILEEYKVPKSIYEIVNSNSIILDTDKPTDALKGKKDSSMRIGIDQVHLKNADACVSAGNTGTLMFTSRMVLGGMENIKRPAIIGLFPTACPINKKCVVLDLGANTTCDEVALSQFAVMGLHFAKIVLDKENPTVAILNVGAESNKGRELEQKTHKLLSAMIPENFIGCIEANDVGYGKVDVIVTDGFSGNILLKSVEGASKICFDSLKKVFSRNPLTKACGVMIKPFLKKEMDFLDPRQSNGAMFIGINGIVVKSHGNSDEIAFSNAINVTASLVRNDVNEKIIEAIGATDSSQEHTTSEILTKIKEKSAKIFGIKQE